MKEYTRKLLDKALDTIEGAEGLTNMGIAEMAAGRAIMRCSMLPRRCCTTNSILNSTSMVRSLRRMGRTLQRQRRSTQNIIAGCGMDLKNAFLEIMEWIQELTRMLPPI